MGWASILDRLEANPSAPGIRLEAGVHGPAQDLPPARLLQLAGLAAEQFRELNVVPGDRIVTLLPTGRPLIQSVLGAWAAGAAICVVAPAIETGRSSLSLERLQAMLAIVEPRLIVAQPGDEARLGPVAAALGAQLIVADRLPSDGVPATGRAVNAPEDMAFIQFTSGSTGLPKAIVIEHGQLVENCRLMAERSGYSETSISISWVPLHHDMGFVAGFCWPLTYGAALALFPTEAFLRNPTSWLDGISKYRATHTFAPGFALKLLANSSFVRRLSGADLTSLKVCWVGAEPVQWSTVATFQNCYEQLGLKEGVVRAAFGLAEATLAVTSEVDASCDRLVWISRSRMVRESKLTIIDESNSDALPVLSNGLPLEGFALSVRGEDGRQIAEGELGRILISGPCVTRRYFGSDENPQPGGWLDTGDLGFLLHGELFITGRAKDVIIRGGVNVHAHDVEEAVLRGLPDLAQRAVAFSLPREQDLRDEVVVGVELRRLPAPDDLASRVSQIVARDIGLQIDHVVALPKGAIPRTTSGKIQRSRARELFRDGMLATPDPRKPRDEEGQ